jgi:peptidoglycan/LPS O-acetylase OafA/YrhL
LSLNYLKYLDSLRALAAIYVVFHHMIIHINAPTNTLFYKVCIVPFLYGHYAVNLFIVLSGYCLMLPVIKNDNNLGGSLKEYFIKRSIRILPPYYLTLIISLLLISTVIGGPTNTAWSLSVPVTTTSILNHIFLIQHIPTDPGINYVLWSVSVEWQIYFLFPLLILAFNKYGNVTTSVAVAVATTLIMFLLSFTTIYIGAGGISIHYIALFCFGMLAAQLSDSPYVKDFVAKTKDYQIVFVLLLSLMLTVVVKKIGNMGDMKDVYSDLLFGIIIGCFLIALALGKLMFAYRFLSISFLSKIGIFAYSIYLIHAPILQLITVFIIIPFQLSPPYSLLVFYLLGIPLIIGISYVFYLVAEKPCIAILKKRKKLEVKLALVPA